MRRKNSVADRVYADIFPQPCEQDPQNWSQHLTRNLVAEVRLETHRFYGSLDTVEAKYPGLNYTFAPHMKRLSYWPHHARLFEAFKTLGLTSQEILTLCRWEGTLWARQRYEQDEGIKVEDTTGNEIKPWQQMEADAVKKKDLPQATESTSQSSSSRHDQRRPLTRSYEQAEMQAPRRITSQSPLSLQLQSTRPADESQQATASIPTIRDVDMYSGDANVPAASQTQTGPTITLTAETLRRMQVLVAMHERGELLDAMNPELEQYIKESLEAHTAGQSSNVLSSLPTAYAANAAQVSITNPVAQPQAMSAVPSAVGDSSHGMASTRTTEIDAR